LLSERRWIPFKSIRTTTNSTYTDSLWRWTVSIISTRVNSTSNGSIASVASITNRCIFKFKREWDVRPDWNTMSIVFNHISTGAIQTRIHTNHGNYRNVCAVNGRKKK